MSRSFHLDIGSSVSGAVFSPCRKYRYMLWRAWDSSLPVVTFIMLNPSTAHARRDDPTIRSCTRLARAWGFGRLRAVNLFAYRATDPRRLSRARDPVGPENDRAITRALAGADLVLAAWGNHGALRDRATHVIGLVAPLAELACLSMTLQGQPSHPLYAPTRSTPARFN